MEIICLFGNFGACPRPPFLGSYACVNLAAASTTIGFIYVGAKDDYGYNQAHAEGAAALKKLSGVAVIEEESVPETVARWAIASCLDAP